MNKIYQTIRYAIESGQSIQLGYAGTVRKVTPTDVVKSADGNIIVKAINGDNEHRSYRLDRIESVEAIESHIHWLARMGDETAASPKGGIGCRPYGADDSDYANGYEDGHETAMEGEVPPGKEYRPRGNDTYMLGYQDGLKDGRADGWIPNE